MARSPLGRSGTLVRVWGQLVQGVASGNFWVGTGAAVRTPEMRLASGFSAARDALGMCPAREGELAACESIH
jgi:hypothetical protein